MRKMARLWVGGSVQSRHSLTFVKDRRERRNPLVKRYRPDRRRINSQQSKSVAVLLCWAKNRLTWASAESDICRTQTLAFDFSRPMRIYYEFTDKRPFLGREAGQKEFDTISLAWTLPDQDASFADNRNGPQGPSGPSFHPSQALLWRAGLGIGSK